MARKSSFNYNKTVRNINKISKALGGTSKKTTRTRAKSKPNNSRISNISSAPQTENTGCLIPLLLLGALPIAISTIL